MSVPITVTVRYFAAVREAIGSGSERVATTAGTAAALRDELIARGAPWDQALSRVRAVRVALDQQLLQDESAALSDGAELAFFPPVTGG